MKTKLIILLVAFMAMAFSSAMGQEAEPNDTPHWYVSFYKIPWAKVDSLNRLVQEYSIPVAEESKNTGTILDYKVLVHHTGGEYNVMIMTLYPSWDAIDRGTGFEVAFQELVSDQEIRDEVSEGFSWIFEGAPHTDTIYREATIKM